MKFGLSRVLIQILSLVAIILPIFWVLTSIFDIWKFVSDFFSIITLKSLINITHVSSRLKISTQE